MPGAKRPVADGPNGTPPVKHLKVEHPEEFSQAVKKKLQASNRTGQACDRCKVRKIRCDGVAGGCGPCLRNDLECRTTDRITGRATSRGYVEGLENANQELQQRLEELERRLAQAGLDQNSNGYHAGSQITNYGAPVAHAPAWNSAATSYAGQAVNGVTSPQEANMFRALPAFRSGCTGDNYLGVSPGNSPLSSIKGTSLSILGMQIDVADFDSLDMDEPDTPSGYRPALYNKSYQAFLQSTLGVNPKLQNVEMPGRDKGFQYAEWYFRALNPYMPLLHKPTFMRLLTRMYDDPSFQPKTAEIVMVHMVFAILMFQFATRNYENKMQQQKLNDQSNKHYHYSLSMFYELSNGHTFQDVQALTLICAHLRNFPKPGASWMLTQTTLSLAIELGLHRSAKRWAPDTIPNPLEVEMRKRTFWGLVLIQITLSGKLGRPMPFRYEDFDIELPEAIDDELLSENGLDTSRVGKCHHDIAIHAIKIGILFMEMYNSIYTVRRQPESYISTVNSLEAKLRGWKDELPQSFIKHDANDHDAEGRVFLLYTQMWALEFRLLLRHPSVSLTNDPAFNSESLRICADSSHQMLITVSQLRDFKSLDTTWYNAAVYVMAITTTLFAHWDKRGEMSLAELNDLKKDMNLWLDIMGDVGALLGSGNRLREKVKEATEPTIFYLDRHTIHRNHVNQSPPIDDTKSLVQRPSAYSTNLVPRKESYDGTAAANMPASSVNNHTPHPQTSYPPATQYPVYNEAAPSNTLTYTPQGASHAYTTYSPNDDKARLIGLAAQASHAQAHTQSNTWQGSPPVGNLSTDAWDMFTKTVATMSNDFSQQHAYGVNTYMQTNGRELTDGGSVNGVHANAGMAVISPVNHTHGGIDQGMGNIGGQETGNWHMQWPNVTWENPNSVMGM